MGGTEAGGEKLNSSRNTCGSPAEEEDVAKEAKKEKTVQGYQGESGNPAAKGRGNHKKKVMSSVTGVQ